MADTVVALEGVSLARGGNRILDLVTLRIEVGQHWVILGPNGAGKTSIVKLISGRDHPSEGGVRVLGSDVSTMDSTYLAAKVGLASSDVRDRLQSNEEVLTLVLTAAWGQSARFVEEYAPEDEQRGLDLLAALGIEDLAYRRFGTLSEGERQRVSIARAIMADPEIVILDEPTAGLDLGARETLVMALRDLMNDPSTPTLILITHEIEEIAPGFTHVALMKNGRIVHSGQIDDVLTSPKLSDAFGLPLMVEKRSGRWWAYAEER